jgi:YidC/Oxa1 family membrane protein insertase
LRCAVSIAERSGDTRAVGLLLTAAAILSLLLPVPAFAGAASLAGDHQLVLINLTGGLPGRWESCRARCAPGEQPRVLIGPGDDSARLAWKVPGDEPATRLLDNLEYEQDVRHTTAGTTVLLTSREPFQGMRLVHRYRLGPDGRTLLASLQVPAGAQLDLTGGPVLAGEPLPGLGGIYTEESAVLINAAGQAKLGGAEGAVTDQALPAGQWAGIRGRFWAVLVQADAGLRLDAGVGLDEHAPKLSLRRDSDGSGSVELRFYGGPVAPADLAAAAAELDGMLYAALWQWLRMLATGLRTILDFWQGVVGNWGLSIMLLSLSVKFLMWPLTWVAERWQAEVNRQHSVLAPDLAAIRRDYKGEEAHNRTLEAYRRHGISQFYTLKSLAGFLVQIPVFIAAFDMLGENFGLNGATFLWVRDLSLTDRAFVLPLVMPFFGGHLNVLPVLMTAFTILAARLQEDASLAPELRSAHRLRLYGMGALFFVLLYTFPAGMVLYWTTNNLLHLARILIGRVSTAVA